MLLEKAISRVSWTHNTKIMVTDYNPLTLIMGKIVVHPGLSTGNIATESMYEDEAAREGMEKTC